MHGKWRTLACAIIAGTGSGLPPVRAQSAAPLITSALTIDAGWVVTYRDEDYDVRYRIAATNAPVQYGATNLPSYVTFDPQTGEIDIPADHPGVFTTTISANNAAGTGSAVLRVAIHPASEGAFLQNGFFKIGDTIDAYASWDENVIVTGFPRLTGPINLTYTSGSGTPILVFSHVITAADVSGEIGGSWLSLDLNGGSIQDAAGLPVIPSIPPPAAPTPTTTYIQTHAFFSAVGAPAGTVGVPFTYAIPAGNVTYFAAQGLPPGLTLDSTRGIISGTPTAAGSYTVSLTATDVGGTAATDTVVIAIAAGSIPTARLVNLSVLAPPGPGAQLLTVGFVSGGAGISGSEPVLIRGIGPALANFGVTAPAADPAVEVFRGQSQIAANDNWGSNQLLVSAANAATGAFPLTDASSLDAALVAALPAGAYSIQVPAASAGMVLAEVYDDSPSGSSSLPHLVNLSCLSQVAPGAVLTAGFVIGSGSPRSVLIRASGPSLAGYGLTGVMPDPVLSVHTSLSGQDTIVAHNTGWGADPALSTAFQAVGAFPYAAGSADSALLLTLSPGSYSAEAASFSSTPGAVLIEIYEAP